MALHREGHPLGGSILIAAIFSVALAFYLATPAPAPAVLTARVAAPIAPLVRDVPAEPPAIVLPEATPTPQPAQPDSLPVVIAMPTVTNVVVAEVVVPAPRVAEPLAAFSWSTVPSPYPLAVAPATFADAGPDRGVMTQAFATAGSAVRSAFKKAF